VAKYLSQEWLDRQRDLGRDLPREVGSSAVVQHVVTGGPDGEVRFVLTVEDGIVAGAVLGADADADVTLTTTYADAVAILHGELDANAAFMQGRVKVVGDMGRLLPLMVLGRTPEHDAVRAALAAETEL
jgi:alkyl sulfatase BDS1-like metallo-beta-lactamase superfamily hydrolase